MKRKEIMVALALCLGCSIVATGAVAQVTNGYTHASASSPNSTVIKFTMSTSPSADVPVGQAGNAGSYPGFLYWDGLTMRPGQDIDPATGVPIQVPSTRYLSPDEKEFTVAVSVTATLPPSITPPLSLSVVARRIRQVDGAIEATGETESINLVLVSASQNGKPTPDGLGNTIYTWRMHDLEDYEALPRRLPGAQDWKIGRLRGRWQLFLFGSHINAVQFKIDKRAQVVGNTTDWVNFWPNRPTDSHDPDPVKLSVFHSTAKGIDLFNDCWSFIQYVYDKHGLSGPRSAADSGPGGMRNFTGHVGIIVNDNTIISDNNPQYTAMTTLQSVLNQLFGADYSAPPYWGVTVDSMNFEPPIVPINGIADFTVADPNTPAPLPGNSLLKVLDAE